MFLVGIGGVGIRQLKVNWEDKDLHKFIYAFIYHLYDPSHFADPSYARTRFNKETSEASYTVDFSTKKFPGFCTIHAVKTHCLLRAAASLMRDEDKGSEGGRRRRGDWQQSPISGGRGLEVVCERDQ